MIMRDLYTDGTYIKQNPTLHVEDSEYKFFYIKQLLDEIKPKNNHIKILDIGGGAGIIGLKVCEYFLKMGTEISFYALDLSKEMLEIQRKNNPYICEIINEPLESLDSNQHFDLILMIDVIEHIPDKDKIANQINNISEYVVYNIPIEINLVDLMRNIKGNYYKGQTATIGHIHFFSFRSLKKFISKHHQTLKWLFPAYHTHILTTECSNYSKQRSSTFRLLELKVCRFIYNNFKIIAPYLITGSLFLLAKKRV